MMKLIVTISLLIVVTFSIVSSKESVGDATADSEQLNVALNNYLNYPSSKNANIIYNLLPKRVTPISNDSSQIFNIDFVDEFLLMLQRQVRNSDRNAVKVAFRYFNISDGYVSESLDMMLGELIRINPLLLLEELHNFKETELSLGHLLGNYGNEYVDKLEASQLETDLRVDALNTIQVDSLNYLRDSCIKILKE